jgi:hypothetical protein
MQSARINLCYDMHARRISSAAALLAATALTGCATPPFVPGCPHGGTRLERYELFFGASRRDGGAITDAEWRGFIDSEVAPRFPDGLTVFDGYGQWRSPDGAITREPSRALQIWVKRSEAADASLEAIRAAFKARFDQDSVMRVDGAEDCVSF